MTDDKIGDEIAIKCPPDPPYPEGWYTGVVVDVIVHGEDDYEARAGSKSNDNMKNFTLQVEWDGGGEEAILNPEWRMKGDAPDKQGRVSHRDAKVNIYWTLNDEVSCSVPCVVIMLTKQFCLIRCAIHSSVLTLSIGSIG